MSMIREIGSPEFQIWLLGDSNPVNWFENLATPLDPRHPARHSIWTPVLDVIQDKVYRHARLRVDTTNVYIRNAIEEPANKPKGNVSTWLDPVLLDNQEFRSLVHKFQPVLVLSFGAFAYEFARRALGETPQYAYGYWGARSMGVDFCKRTENFNPKQTNIFPLLHVTIARGKFIESHNYYCDQTGANYFDYTGSRLAEILLAHRDSLNVWIP